MKMSANDRRLVTIIISAVLFIVGYCLAQELTTARLVIFSVALLCVGAEVFIRAGRNILHGQIFDENFLMSIASICAFILGDYPEATAVMLFYQIGEYFQSRAVNRSRRSISELMDIRPDYANISRDGQLEKVYPDEVHVGDTIIIKPGAVSYTHLDVYKRQVKASSRSETASICTPQLINRRAKSTVPTP